LKKEADLVRQSSEKVQEDLRETDNYLEKYLPFKIQNFITETLVNTMSRKNLPRLNDYT
jgi:hypothetical protein